MKTGNTGRLIVAIPPPGGASMEPGHEDREYSGEAANSSPV